MSCRTCDNLDYGWDYFDRNPISGIKNLEGYTPVTNLKASIPNNEITVDEPTIIQRANSVLPVVIIVVGLYYLIKYRDYKE